MTAWLWWIGGALICLLNIYLSWLRYPLHLARGGTRDTFRWVSGIPFFGSTAVVAVWFIELRQQESPALDVATWLLALLDSGGIHWFIGTLTWHWLADRAKAGT